MLEHTSASPLVLPDEEAESQQKRDWAASMSFHMVEVS